MSAEALVEKHLGQDIRQSAFWRGAWPWWPARWSASPKAAAESRQTRFPPCSLQGMAGKGFCPAVFRPDGRDPARKVRCFGGARPCRWGSFDRTDTVFEVLSMIIYLHGFDATSPGNHEKVRSLQFIDDDVRFVHYSTVHPRHDMSHLLKRSENSST